MLQNIELVRAAIRPVLSGCTTCHFRLSQCGGLPRMWVTTHDDGNENEAVTSWPRTRNMQR